MLVYFFNIITPTSITCFLWTLLIYIIDTDKLSEWIVYKIFPINEKH